MSAPAGSAPSSRPHSAPPATRSSAVAGESAASRTRIETLLPGVRVDKPTAVSRACDLLLLTVPDDMLANVVTMLAASGAIRPGQHVVHTSGKHGLAVLAPAADVGARGARDAPGDDLHRHRRRPRPAARLRLRRHRHRRDPRRWPSGSSRDLGGSVVWVDEDQRTLYHAGLAHGANHLVTLVAQAMDLLRASGADGPGRARCARCSPPRSTTRCPTATRR